MDNFVQFTMSMIAFIQGMTSYNGTSEVKKIFFRLGMKMLFILPNVSSHDFLKYYPNENIYHMFCIQIFFCRCCVFVDVYPMAICHKNAWDTNYMQRFVHVDYALLFRGI